VQRVERKRRNRPFCSQTCAKAKQADGRRVKMITITCGWCGDRFETWPSKVGRKKFCSRRCAGLGRPLNGKPSKIGTAAIDEWSRSTWTPPYQRELRLGRWSVDLAFPDVRLAVELDGTYWHSLPAMVEKDARKDAWLADAGWTVVRIPIPKDATAQGVAADIAAAVARSHPEHGRAAA